MKKILALTVSLLVLNGCTPIGLATSAGAVGGIAAAREGGISQSATDARIKLEVSELWFKYDVEAFRKLNMTVEQGRVLVTGIVQDPDHRVEAIRLAWQPKGVKQVINEVQLANSEGIQGYARDTWIGTQLRSKLLFDKDIQSINYTVDVVGATVYLMGIAQDQAELNKVLRHARTTTYVKQVVSYVKMAGDEVDAMGEPVTMPSQSQQQQGGAYQSQMTPMPQQQPPVQNYNEPSAPTPLSQPYEGDVYHTYPTSSYSSTSTYETYESGNVPSSPGPVQAAPLDNY